MGIEAASSNLPPQLPIEAQVGVAVLKKSRDVEAQAAQTLIDAIPKTAPQPAAKPDPTNPIGQNIDTFA